MDLSYESILQQLGNFHFLVLHFPIVFIFLLPVLLVLVNFKFGKIWAPIIPYFIHLGSLSAIVVSSLGLSLLTLKGGEDKIFWHRNLAYTTTAIMILLSILIIILKPDYSKKVPLYVYILGFSAALILMLAAHLGGESVHGTLITIFGGG